MENGYTEKRSPVGAILIGVITFIILFFFNYFAIGMVLIAAVLVGAVSYFRRSFAPAVLLVFMLIPVSTLVTFTNLSSAIAPLSAIIICFMAVLALCYLDWFGALVGLWLGLFLYSGVSGLAVIPVIALMSVFGGLKRAAVASAVFVVFGFFFMNASFFGFIIPPVFYQNMNAFFPNLNAISNIPFASILMVYIFGSNWQQSLNSSLAATILNNSPVYFIIVSVILIMLSYYLYIYFRRTFLGPSLSKLFGALIGTVVAASLYESQLFLVVSLYGTQFFLAFSLVTVLAIWFICTASMPLLGHRPKLSFEGIAQIARGPAVLEAATIRDKDGAVLVAQNPSKVFKGMSYWDRARGLDEVKEELFKSVILPMNRKTEAKIYGVKPVKGILLYGPPGTGKTMLLRGLASKLAMTYIEVNPATLLSKWYGESEHRMRKVVDTALNDTPSILAIDELDSIGKDRSSYSNDDVTPRVLNMLLMGMDKISQSDAEVLVMATTNKPQLLDQALLRAGRFDKIIYVGPPSESAREEIFKLYLGGREKVVADNIDYPKIAKMAERFTGADIEALVNKVMSAAFYDKVLSNKEQRITEEVLENAIKATKPTIDYAMLEEFEKFRLEFQREKKLVKGWETGIPNVKFDDIGDLEEVKKTLRESFELPFNESELVQKLNVQPVKGILLYGPPGNGKTLLAKAVATEVASNFFTLSGADISKSGPENAMTRVKELFNLAKENCPAIIFIDEIDQLAPDRSNPTGADFIPVTTQLLAELDGVKDLKQVMVLAATNRPQNIDSSLLRSNRLEKHLLVPLPDEAARTKIFDVCLRGINCKDVSTADLAKMSEGFSGADIHELVNNAKQLIVSESMSGTKRDWITMDDFKAALEKKKKESIDSSAMNQPPITDNF